MDLELRELERRALAGDAEAALRFVALHRRTLVPDEWQNALTAWIDRTPSTWTSFECRLNSEYVRLDAQICSSQGGILQMLMTADRSKLLLTFLPEDMLQGKSNARPDPPDSKLTS